MTEYIQLGKSSNYWSHIAMPELTWCMCRWYTEMEEPLCQIFPTYVSNSRYYPDDTAERSDGGWRDQLPPPRL